MAVSSPKRLELCGAENQDLISNLPDSVLCHILSFLSTLECARASCVSRRWRYLWTSVPSLHFDYYDYELQLRTREPVNPFELFERFVNTVFMLRSNPSIQRFYFHLPSSPLANINAAYIDSWILAACTHNVEDMDIFVARLSINIPHILFYSKNLVSLKLCTSNYLDVPESVNLPSLKVLHLLGSCPSFADINRIVSGCPLLEDLEIEIDGDLNGPQPLSILSSTLKRFLFMNVHSMEEIYSLILGAPQLEFLVLRDGLSLKPHVEIKHFYSMTSAVFDFFYCGDNLLDGCWLGMVPIIEKFKIEALSMSFFTLLKAMTGNTINQLHCWVNLTQLELSYCGADLNILPHVLESFPNLKDLELKYLKCDHKIVCEALKEEKPEIYCLKHSLKTLELCSFSGKEAEMQVAEFFLKTAGALKEIRIDPMDELEEEIMKKILMFPRCSETCQVEVVEI